MGAEVFDKCNMMDVLCYEDILSELKESFNFVTDNQDESIKHCNKILEDCKACIKQTFYLIIDKTEKSTDENKLCSLLGNAVTILKMLGSYLQNLVQSIPMLCHTTQLFPTTTGNIIYEVFKHCKDSECTYGIYLRGVENQLKDLFRMCHELQMIYLMIFEKYFVIDLDVREEQEVLLASLDIYLKICDIVQGLDVKTMAEQWKAYTVICEKYATYLCNTHVFDNCIEYIVATIKTNMTLESVEDDKAVVRSLKVAGFILKILSKLCSIFKNTKYNHEKILELFLSILPYKNDLYPRQYPKHSNLIDTLILSPVDNLLELVMNEEFLNYVTNTFENNPRQSDMSYIIMLASTMLHMNHNINRTDSIKVKLMGCLFTLLPHCHISFNTPSRFKLNGGKSCELYEYLLIHVVSFTSTLTMEQYKNLEKQLFEKLLSTDHLSALFASDVWVILCRNNNKLHLNTLTGLIRNYQKLEANPMFQTSPQKQYILHHIQKMFKTLPYDDKILIYRQFNVQDGRNKSVWGVMMTALPDNVRNTAENILREHCLRYLSDFLTLKNIRIADLNSAIQDTKLISNCTFHSRDLRDIEDVLADSWLKCCPNSQSLQRLNIKSISYIRYVESLTHWTCNFINKFHTSTSIKILHIVSRILEVGNIEMTLILFELYCQLLWETDEDDDILVEIFLRTDAEDLKYIFAICMSNVALDNFISRVLSKESSTKEVLNGYLNFKNNGSDLHSCQLESTFVHKCPNTFEVKTSKFIKIGDKVSENKVIEAEQPLTKKAKIDPSAIENIIVDMERNASQLYQDRAILNDDQKRRLQNVCGKLKSIIS